MTVVQEFATVDVVRLEIETDPAGLVNLVQNPNGEFGGWGWITPLTASTMGGSAGRLAYAKGNTGASYFTSENLPVAAGQYVAARLNAVGAGPFSGANYYRVRFEWVDSDGVLLSSSTQSGYRTLASGAGTLGPYQAPASTAYVRLRFDLYSSTGGANPTGTNSFEFNGVTVAAAATSGELVTVRTNRCPNPSFETALSPWVAYDDPTLTRVTTSPYVGTYCLQVASNPIGNEATVGFIATGLTVGATYTASAYVKGSGASSVALFAGGGSSVSSPSGVWTRVSRTFTASASSMEVVLAFSGPSGGFTGWVDAVMVERSDTAGAYFDGATPDAGGWDYAWTGTAGASTSTATYSALDYIPPVEYLNVLPDSHEIRVPRKELNVGAVNATILSSTLDPSQSDLIRPGRRGRLTTLVDGEWETIIAGKVLEADVVYELKDPAVPEAKRARISVTIVDAAQPLTNVKRPEAVAAVDDLPFVLEGAGVPWSVNGSGTQVPVAVVTAVNDGASALDQVALTRDTALGFAWVSRLGVINVWDRDEIASGSPLLLDEDDYSDLDLSFSTKDCINEVAVIVQSVGTDGATIEATYGPYRDTASIAEWGTYSKTFTVTGLADADVAAYAAAILAAAATPRIRVNSITLPLSTITQLEAKVLIDLYDEVRVVLTDRGIDDTLRVTGLEHVIDTEKWMLRLEFSDEGGVASPTIQPPVQSGVTLAQLLRPVGEVTMWFGAKADIPAPWLALDGSTFDGDVYPLLEDLLGGTTLPDLTDRFPIGAGSKALASVGGSPTATLVAANLPPHAHTMNHGHDSKSSQTTIANASTHFLRGNGTTNPVTNGLMVENFTGITGNGPGTSTPVNVLNPWVSLWFIVRAA